MKYIPFSQAKRYNLIELCACRNMIVHHQKMELFFAFLTIRMSEDTHRKLSEYAAKHKMSMTEVALRNLEKFLSTQE